jgi:uncharacterized lipoprotein YbaY
VTLLVSGNIIVKADVAPFSGATAHVQLENVTVADAAARILVRSKIASIDHPTAVGQDTVIPFSLRAEEGSIEIQPRHAYGVRVWIDVNSSGRPESGDLFSDQSYRVLTQGFGNTVHITLES